MNPSTTQTHEIIRNHLRLFKTTTNRLRIHSIAIYVWSASRRWSVGRVSLPACVYTNGRRRNKEKEREKENTVGAITQTICFLMLIRNAFVYH